jgi:hypothetical protein
MRSAIVLTLSLLAATATFLGQDAHGTYYKDKLSWGENKETFKITLGPRRSEGVFMVSELGLRWASIVGEDRAGGPLPWDYLRSWSCGRGPALTVTIPNNDIPFALGFQHDDLVRLVNQYLRKYAPEALDVQKGCAPERL